MPEWRVHTLSEVYEFASGLSKPRSEFGSGFPFLSFKDVFYNRFVPKALDNLVQSSDAERKKCSIKRGDVFLTRTSETMDELGMSCVCLSDVPDATFNGFTKRLRPKDKDYILPEYAGYFFSSPRFRQSVNAMSTMSTRASLNNDMLSRLEIVVPEPDDQLRIANLLKPLDDKIELNRRMNETLEEMARALFRDWFVDFGPTRRQMDGATDPAAIMGHAFPPEKAAVLASLFPAKLGEDGLPEGWETIPFGDALADTIGGDWGKEVPDEKHDVEVAIVRGTDFAALQGGEKGKVPQRFTTGKKAERRILTPGDILLEVSGGSPKQPTGRSLWVSQAMLERFDCDVVPASFCRRFRPKDAAWSLVLRQHLNDLYLRGGTWEYQNQSTGISNFQTTHFLEAEQVVDPSEAILAAFHDVVEPLVQKTATNENQTLAALRDLLLPKLMSGEIRLKDVEAVL